MRFLEIKDIISDEIVFKKLTLPPVTAKFIEIEYFSKADFDSRYEDDGNEDHLQFPFARTKLLKVPIKSGRTLVNAGENSKKVIEIIFDLSNINIDITPGNTIGILPENNDEEIDHVLNALNLMPIAESMCELKIMKNTKKKNAKLPAYIRAKCGIREIIKKYLNIRMIPKKLFIRSLVDYTTDDVEKRFLEVLCSKEGAEIYSKNIIGEQLTFMDLLKLCPTCHPPFELLVEHLNQLQPRVYSIANSPLVCSNEIKIICSISNDHKVGLTTRMLDELVTNLSEDRNNQYTVNMYFRESNAFKYDVDEYVKDSILIGVGCAISPFLGFLEHKNELQKSNDHLSLVSGRTWLFSGNRCLEHSIYNAKLQEYYDNGLIEEFFQSFSRDFNSSYKYVQDQIKANSVRFVDFLFSKNTKLYICADGAHISQNIENTIVDCIANYMDCSQQEAKNTLLEFKKQSKYIEDIWL